MRELATDRAGLEILHLGDCFRLLESVPVGRIGFIAGGEVVILPVNFLVDGQDVVFTTGAGSKLSAVEVGHYVGFEADSYDPATRAGWSVVVNGLAEIVDSDARPPGSTRSGSTLVGRDRPTGSGCGSGRRRSAAGASPRQAAGLTRPAPAAGRRSPAPELVGGAVGLDGLQLVPAGVPLDLGRVAAFEQLDEARVLADGRAWSARAGR